MLRMRVNRGGIQRLRTLTESLRLTDLDRKGPLLRELDNVHIRQARQAFSTEGASTGSRWQRLSPRYAAWKRRAYPGRRILVRSAAMRAKFLQPTASGHIRRWLGGFRFAFGVADEKAWKHENAAGALPRRSVIQKTAKQLQEFTQAFEAFYIKRVRQVLRHAR